MMKAFGKLLTLGVITGAAAAGIYHYLQGRDSELVDVDDFDDLDNFEGVKEEAPTRSYVDLGKAGEMVSGAADKAKTVVKDAYEKVKESGAIDKAKEIAKDTYEKVSEKIQDLTSQAPENAEDVEVVKDAKDEAPAAAETSAEADSTESFFDDKDSE